MSHFEGIGAENLQAGQSAQPTNFVPGVQPPRDMRTIVKLPHLGHLSEFIE